MDNVNGYGRVERYTIVRNQIKDLRKSYESATGSVRMDTLD